MHSSWGVVRQITLTPGMREVGLTEKVKVDKDLGQCPMSGHSSLWAKFDEEVANESGERPSSGVPA